jgi:hypothetical protein
MNIDVDSFYVIAVISNPVRYKTRVRLFKKFQEEMNQAGVKLLVVELAYGNRHFEITEVGNPFHLQLRTSHELWHKENLINLGVRRLSEVAPHWKYFAFIDADITLLPSHWAIERESWVHETVHQLQHHHVVQMFQHALDLGPHGQTFGKYEGFAWAYIEGKFESKSYKYTSFHPGYCWAMRRESFNHLGGLIETAIMGAGDRHMSYGLIGMMKESLNPGLNPNYAVGLLEWEKRAEKFIQRDLGYVPGTVIHHWHGKKKDRRYHDRWRVLIDNQFDPNTDLKRNDQGVLELVVITSRQIKLREDIRKYMRARNEDSLDME